MAAGATETTMAGTMIATETENNRYDDDNKMRMTKKRATPTRCTIAFWPGSDYGKGGLSGDINCGQKMLGNEGRGGIETDDRKGQNGEAKGS